MTIYCALSFNVLNIFFEEAMRSCHRQDVRRSNICIADVDRRERHGGVGTDI